MARQAPLNMTQQVVVNGGAANPPCWVVFLASREASGASTCPSIFDNTGSYQILAAASPPHLTARQGGRALRQHGQRRLSLHHFQEHGGRLILLGAVHWTAPSLGC